MEVLEQVWRLWAAASVTEEADRQIGTDRSDVIRSLEAHAWWLSRDLDSHPIDAALASERSRYMADYEPRDGQWWSNVDQCAQGRAARAVVAGLTWVRKGGRPTDAAKLARHVARELPVHHQDSVELRIYHLCRVAGVPVL